MEKRLKNNDHANALRRERHYQSMAEFSRELDLACLVENCRELADEVAPGRYYQMISALELSEYENYQNMKVNR